MESEVLLKGRLAKKASYELLHLTVDQKNNALKSILKQLQEEQSIILKANELDTTTARENGIEEHIIDRIALTPSRLQSIYTSILQCIELTDPIGNVVEDFIRPDQLHIIKKVVPLGVVGIIYEARPNVTVDAAILTLKTNNAVILRGSSSAIHSNKAIVSAIQRALEANNITKNAVQLIEDTSRETAKQLFTLKEYLDVLIPRGGKKLIDTVVEQATVPVIETGAGNCHIYIDHEADEQKAISIILNAKLQRPSVCNAAESLLIHEQFIEQNGTKIIDTLLNNHVELFVDDYLTAKYPSLPKAHKEHYAEEFLRPALSVKVVKSMDEALNHIQIYSSKHSEAIITENAKSAQYFLTVVDAAAVYHNASTRFTDGFEFGYGAEIGISTQKLHARGPMGLDALTSWKYIILGDGHIRQ